MIPLFPWFWNTHKQVQDHSFTSILNTLYKATCLLVYLFSKKTVKWGKHAVADPYPEYTIPMSVSNWLLAVEIRSRLEHCRFVDIRMGDRQYMKRALSFSCIWNNSSSMKGVY